MNKENMKKSAVMGSGEEKLLDDKYHELSQLISGRSSKMSDAD